MHFYINKASLYQNTSRWVAIVISALFIFINIIEGFPEKNKIAVAYGVLFISAYLVWYVRKNSELVFIFMFFLYSNYSICFCNYINVMRGTIYSSYADYSVSTYAINILFIFLFFILCFLPTKINRAINRGTLIYKENYNLIILVGLYVILAIIFFFGFIRPKQSGIRGTPTPLYEYATILFILCYYYCGNNVTHRRITGIIILLFSFQNFFYGGRIMGIQFILVMIIFFYLYKINLFKNLPILIAAVMVFIILGNVRANHNITVDVLTEIMAKIKQTKFTLDTAYSSYFTSMTFLQCETFISNSDRLAYFIKFLRGIIIGTNEMDGSSLSSWTRKFYHHSGGGLLPYYFHFYLGWIGVAFSGWYVSFFVRIVNGVKSKACTYINLIGIYFIVSTFRYYLYTPISLFRGMLIFSIMFWVCEWFNWICKKRKYL